jgi:hypothetical protein
MRSLHLTSQRCSVVALATGGFLFALKAAC